MRIIDDGLKSVCLICFQPTDGQTLRSNHHCCDRSRTCIDKFREITQWERKNFGKSFLEQLSREY